MAKQIGNGSMKLPLYRGRYYRVYGGRYAERPEFIAGHKTLGVCMAAEIGLPANVVCPVADFQVPTASLADEALGKTVMLVLTGAPVYVGCAGGIGRTGLMLALLAKAFGEADPVQYVRKNYIPHAVETGNQKAFVASYEVKTEVKLIIAWFKFKSLFRRRFELTAGRPSA